jgi:hypothetical protein
MHESNGNGQSKSEGCQKRGRMRSGSDNHRICFGISLRGLDTADTALPHDDLLDADSGFNAGAVLSGSLCESAGRGHGIGKTVGRTIRGRNYGP